MSENQKLTAAVREGIDACRAGHDDLRSPELAEVARAVIDDTAAATHFERVQRCDAKLQSAMTDVAVPDDLAQKMLSRLRMTHIDPSTSDVAVTQTEPPTIASRRSRRTWLSMALAASLLVAASMIAFWAWGPTEPVNVATLADVWQEQLSGEWRNMASAPKSLPIPLGLGVIPRGWQPTSTYMGYKAVAYEFSLQGVRGVLFVVNESPDDKLPNRPPLVPDNSSGGRAVAAWMSGKHLCVLVVNGDEKAYRTLIRASQGPLA